MPDSAYSVREERHRHGLTVTQQELAQALGVSPALIQYWERLHKGKIRAIRPDIRQRIDEALVKIRAEKFPECS